MRSLTLVPLFLLAGASAAFAQETSTPPAEPTTLSTPTTTTTTPTTTEDSRPAADTVVGVVKAFDLKARSVTVTRADGTDATFTSKKAKVPKQLKVGDTVRIVAANGEFGSLKVVPPGSEPPAKGEKPPKTDGGQAPAGGSTPQ